MKKTDAEDFVMRYLEATRCQIIEKNVNHVTVKLSPEADRDLTNRSFYWSFVDRTSVEPETMTFTFMFDTPAAATVATTSTLASAAFTSLPAAGRAIVEPISFGSKRLGQLFQSAKAKGRFVHLFEEPQQQKHPAMQPASYYTWFGVNYNIGFICDMKRSELHSLGISLSTGEIVENFHDSLLSKPLTPKLPPNTHIRDMISLQRAKSDLNQYLEKKLRTYDHTWAAEAHLRWQVEMNRLDEYYLPLPETSEMTEQYRSRKEETEWQYRPRIHVNLINGGLFHLF